MKQFNPNKPYQVLVKRYYFDKDTRKPYHLLSWEIDRAYKTLGAAKDALKDLKNGPFTKYGYSAYNEDAEGNKTNIHNYLMLKRYKINHQQQS